MRKAALEALEGILTDVQAAAWLRAHVAALIEAATASPSTPASVAAAAALECLPSPTFALHCAHRAAASVGARDAVVDASGSAPTVGYGKISGYGAGSRLVSSAAASACPDSPVTANGLFIGARVTGAYGPGRVVGVAAAGALAEVAFASGSTGACCFPYGSAFLRATTLRPLEPAPAGGAAPPPLPPAPLSVVVLAEDVQGYLPPDACADVVGCFLRQLAEKLDLLRGAAGEALCRLLHLPWPLPPVPGVPHRERLHAAFPPPAAPARVSAAGAAAASGATADDAALAAIPEADVGGEEDATPGPASEAPAAGGVGGGGAALEEGGATPASPASASSSSGVQWSLAHDAFPRVAGLLDLPEYTPAIAQVRE